MKRMSYRLYRLLLAGGAIIVELPAAQAQVADARNPATQAQMPSSAQGQPVGAETNDSASSDIIVTAQKREQSLSKVPMSITAITGDQLRDRGIIDIAGLVKVTPGLSYVESGNGTPVFSLRGVGFFDTTLGALPSVAVYQDQVPLVFSVMAQGAAFDLERVEVLKGPQGTLFGQNATGGAINYIAARPTKELAAGFDVSFARFNELDANGYVSGPLSEAISARVAVRAERGGDWQESYTRNDSLGAKRFYQGRVAFDIDVSDRLKLIINLMGFIDKSDTQAAQKINIINPAAVQALRPLTAAYPNSPDKDRAADWDASQTNNLRRDNYFYQPSLHADYKLSSSLTITSITDWSYMKIDQLLDQDGMNLVASLDNIRGRLQSFSQEVRMSGNFGPAILVIGGNYSRDRSTENDNFFYPYTVSAAGLGALLNLPDPNNSGLVGSQRFQNKAIFGNVDWDLSPLFTVHGGIRYTDSRDAYASCATANSAATAAAFSKLFSNIRAAANLPPLEISQGGCITLNDQLAPVGGSGTLKEDNVSWRTGIDWKPVPGTLIYANVSRGYKAGSAPVLAVIQASQTRPVVQESVLAYELGFKAAVIRRSLDVSGALFYYDYNNKQVLGRVNTILGPYPGLANVPRSKIQGAEFQANVYPARGMIFTLAGTYLDSKVTAPFISGTIVGSTANFEGDALPYTPKYQVVADWQYVVPMSGRLNLILGTNLNYRSATIAGFGQNDPFTAANININAYTLVDARAGIQAPDKKWQATLFVRNLTDKYYWTNVNSLSDVIPAICWHASHIRYPSHPEVLTDVLVRYGLRDLRSQQRQMRQ